MDLILNKPDGLLSNLSRRVVIIIDLEVLKSASDVEKTIGEPVPYVEGNTCDPYSLLLR